jgi:hypothetical protein
MDVEDVTADSSWHLYELLCQDEQWIDQDGAMHRVADMQLEHVVNLLRWLHRHAFAIAQHCAAFLETMPTPAGHTAAFDQVAADADAEHAHMVGDPVGWLGDTELVTALRARVTGVHQTFSAPFPQIKRSD